MAALPAAGADGPLRRHATNPRYFADSAGRAVYLAGSHTWASVQDMGDTDPPAPFDFTAFLDRLQSYGHNFTRLWTWEQARYHNYGEGDAHFVSPLPYRRTGPGLALDGRPRFDLERLDEAFFRRLHDRAAEASRRGIYVSVMLFNGWSIEPAKGHEARNNPWRAHPFNGANNVNGLAAGRPGVWLLGWLRPAWQSSGRATHVDVASPAHPYQERYVERVVDAVNDLDNVLYEVSNESPAESAAWQYAIVRHLRAYEAAKPKQHPIGMTASWPGGSDAALFASPADWISPGRGSHDYLRNPPAADGRKVILSDTDHLCGVCGDPRWPWKSFTRGLNPILMDVCDATYPGETPDPDDPALAETRRQLGLTVALSRRIDLGRMAPRGDLSSTGYCLAATGDPPEYVVYAPDASTPLRVDLSPASGELAVTWLDPRTGHVVQGARVAGGGCRSLPPPFPGDAVLHMSAAVSGVSPAVSP